MLASLSKKNGFVFFNEIWHFKALNEYSVTHIIRFRFLRDFKQIYRKLKYKKKSLGEFQSFPHFPREMGLYSPTKFGILKP